MLTFEPANVPTVFRGVKMAYFKRVFAKLGIMGELLSFFWERKLWWLIPMICMLLLFGLLIVFTHGTAVAPFIYTLF